jgi:hypothetical protein
MNVKYSLNVSHLVLLILGLFFYTAIGLIFIIPSVMLRVIVFLLLILVAQFKKQHYIVILIACIIGLLINPFSDWQFVISNVLKWGTLTGCIVGGIIIYENIFAGGDFASISKFFKNKNKIAIYAYYVFKIMPMIFDMLDRLAKAYMVYGKRKYVTKTNSFKLNIFFDVTDSFFNELLTIMFSQIRVLSRRETVAFAVSSGKRTVSLKLFVVQLLVILFVLTALILHFCYQ